MRRMVSGLLYGVKLGRKIGYFEMTVLCIETQQAVNQDLFFVAVASLCQRSGLESIQIDNRPIVRVEAEHVRCTNLQVMRNNLHLPEVRHVDIRPANDAALLLLADLVAVDRNAREGRENHFVNRAHHHHEQNFTRIGVDHHTSAARLRGSCRVTSNRSVVRESHLLYVALQFLVCLRLLVCLLSLSACLLHTIRTARRGNRLLEDLGIVRNAARCAQCRSCSVVTVDCRVISISRTQRVSLPMLLLSATLKLTNLISQAGAYFTSAPLAVSRKVGLYLHAQCVLGILVSGDSLRGLTDRISYAPSEAHSSTRRCFLMIRNFAPTSTHDCILM